MGGLEPPRPKSPAPQECLPKRRKQRIYNNLRVNHYSVVFKIVAVPVI